MRRIFQLILPLLMGFCCAACHSSVSTAGHQSTREIKLADGTVVVQIGSCAGTQTASEHVESILLAKGIRPVMQGSRAYAICVPQDRAEKARELLRSDPQKEVFRILVYDD